MIDLGRWDEALAILDEAIDRGQSGWWRAVPLQVRAWSSWLTGDLDAVEQDLDEIRRLAPDLTEGQLDYAEVQLIAAMALEADQWETAVETVANTLRQLPVEDGLPVVHWETMTAAWLGLWGCSELARSGVTPAWPG